MSAPIGPFERQLYETYRAARARIWEAGRRRELERAAAAAAEAMAKAAAAAKAEAAKAAIAVAVIDAAVPTAPRRVGYVPSIRLTALLAAERYDIPLLTLISPVREARAVRCRQIAMAVSCRWHTLTEIGRYYRRDHTTVMHARKAVQERSDQSEDYRREVAELAEMVERAFEAGRTVRPEREAAMMEAVG